MKNIILILICALSLGSCMTAERMQRRCEKLSLLCGAERIVTVYKDTTIYINKNIEVKLPGDTITIVKTLQEKNGSITMSAVAKQIGLITATAWITDNKLHLFAFLNKKELKINVKDTIVITKYITKEAKTITVREKYIPLFFKVSGWIFGGTLLLVVFWTAVMIKPSVASFLRGLVAKG